MQYLVFEFPTEKEMRDTVKKLWDGYNVSGEMMIRPLSGGKWRVEVHTEKELRESTLEKFADYRIEGD
ncbi:hypothetical protein J2Z79_001134 [Symbiobacterium terraclitae]|uniref:Uncharacterized protein n=1 Tax=Symbiobacterium terraclitae TaxID=557451 RepID=A0ABS4JTG0_9FIRM|nr:hypothetical protein [Symbiobacterium terraclitae]MBP2017749.1 hypothetical protein [Symbiobacterium terraclitae]